MKGLSIDTGSDLAKPLLAWRGFLGPIAYGVLFCALIPSALSLWLQQLDIALTGVAMPPSALGWPLVAGGILIICWSMALLIVRGRGLPMNAYPTTAWVGQGPYRLVRHPIYAAFVLCVCGGAIAFGSPKGLFVGAPLASLACTALVVGYEAPATARRLGPPPHSVWFGMPVVASPERAPTITERIGAGITVFGTWLTLYFAVAALPAAPRAWFTSLPVEGAAPFIPASVVVCSLTCAWALLPLAAVGTTAGLRRFAEQGVIGTGAGMAIVLLFSSLTPYRGDIGSDVLGGLLSWRRAAASPTSALPSFNVFWTVLAARHLAMSTQRGARRLLVLLTFAQIAASHLTGMDSLLGIIAGLALVGCAIASRELARCALQAAQAFADKAGSISFGPIRLFYHALPVFAAGCVGYGIAIAFLPEPDSLLPMNIVVLSALLGAGAWGWALEGDATSRPFGFFGGFLAALIAALLLAGLDCMSPQQIAASTIALPFAQAVGRLRCLMHGCCHGRLCAATEHGLRYTHPLSRVAAIPALAGRPILPTQLFSLLANVLIGLVLIRMARSGADIAHIIAAYLVTMGLSRFCEEASRGEPNTPIRCGLNLYQWLAIAVALAGLALALVAPLGTLPSPRLPTFGAWLSTLPFVLLWTTAFSVDWPRTGWPLSRLSAA
ncbi:MAG: prolipoprotein diacylglyceryl transferase [Proteobacteria bacterium]|nr:prolipoprotein diacylglyceryl transferase [Pseudomonadota bacterium]